MNTTTGLTEKHALNTTSAQWLQLCSHVLKRHLEATFLSHSSRSRVSPFNHSTAETTRSHFSKSSRTNLEEVLNSHPYRPQTMFYSVALLLKTSHHMWSFELLHHSHHIQVRSSGTFTFFPILKKVVVSPVLFTSPQQSLLIVLICSSSFLLNPNHFHIKNTASTVC